MSALSRKKVLASFHAIDALAREANVPYQLAFDALNALVVAYEDEHAAEALRVRLRKYESGTTPMTDAPMLNALLAIISSYRVAACLSIPEQLRNNRIDSNLKQMFSRRC